MPNIDKFRITIHNLTNQLFTLISKVLQEEDDLKGKRSTNHGRTIFRTSVLLLAVVLAAALALRLLHLSAVSQTAFVDFHQVFTASDMHTT